MGAGFPDSRESEASQKGDDWQTMEAAPMDGTQVLVWNGRRHVAEFRYGEWRNGRGDEIRYVRLWQHLPAPPAEGR